MWRNTIGAIAMLVSSAGCYASHGPREEGGALCVRPRTETGSGCATSRSTVPSGVCRLADGALIAFGDLVHDATCGPVGREDPSISFAFEPHRCEGEVPRTRVVALCGPSSDVPVFSQVERPPGRTVTFDLTDASCALSRNFEGEPAEPWEPFVEADLLCADPYAWCGSPMVLELRQPHGDPHGGCTFTHRCRARVEGDRIVLHAETAGEAPGSRLACETSFEDRIARCVVPPLPAGRYEVVDQTERVLGAVTVPAVRPEGDLDPTCTPL